MITLIGFLLPPIIDVINRFIKDSSLRFLVSVLICGVIGLSLNYITTDGFKTYVTMMDYADGISSAIIQVFGWAQLSYKAVWENMPVRDNLKLNAKTNY